MSQPAAAISGTKSDSPLSTDLRQLGMAYDLGMMNTPVTTSSTAAGTVLLPISNAPIMQYGDGQVMVEVVANSTDEVADLMVDLEALGMADLEAWDLKITGLLPMGAIASLETLDSIKLARPVYVPTSSVGTTTSQAVEALNTETVLTDLGIDGSGVTVGVLSDSYDRRGNAAAVDIASGDLPGADNPLGYTQEVLVLEDDLAFFNIDEGRAMMQLIHDIAPGADLAFHTAFISEVSFANGILELAEAGSDVIVDDIIYLTEPMFQDGVVAQAVDTVVADGVAYFSSAGNNGRDAYESAFVASGINALQGELHDFDPGPGVDPFQSITVPQGQGFSLSFQWDQPFGSLGSAGSASDVDIFLLDRTADGFEVVASAATNNLGGDPLEILAFTNTGGFEDDEFFLVISTFDGDAPDLMKYVLFADSGVEVNEYDTASGTIYGHANAAGAQAVGAAFYQDTPAFGVDPAQLESFSSAGTTPILFDTEGNRLDEPEVRLKPEIVAPDGTNTTFFFPGEDPEGDGFPNFFGTSAAAPHAAAVAALMIAASPTVLSPDDIYTVLQETALDMDDPFTEGFDVGFDVGTGFGLIQGDLAVLAVLGDGLDLLAEDNGSLTTAALSPVNGASPGTITAAGTIGDIGRINAASDVDLVAITLTAGDELVIDLDAAALGSALDASLRLFDSAGNLVAVNDDGAAPDEALSLDSYLTYVAPTDDTYYLGISSYDNKTYDPLTGTSTDGSTSGDYTLTLTVAAGTLPIPGESNDTLATATAVTLTDDGFSITATVGNNPDLAAGLDVDLYAITLDAGETLALDIDTIMGSSLDAVLTVFGPAGAVIAQNDDAPAPGEAFTLDSYLEFTATTATTYYVGVSGFANTAYDPTVAGSGVAGSTGDYTLTITELG